MFSFESVELVGYGASILSAILLTMIDMYQVKNNKLIRMLNVYYIRLKCGGLSSSF